MIYLNVRLHVALKNRIVTPVKEVIVIDNEGLKGPEMCYPITDPMKNKCPFLTDNCRCNIYDRRPPICRKFGNGSEPLLTCAWELAKKICKIVCQRITL